MKKLFGLFTIYDIVLLGASVVAIVLSFTLSPSRDYLTLTSSVIGVTALMFIVKGHVAGQILTIAFAVVYGTVSYFFAYYGEMITYLGMSAPAAVMATVSWLRHPHKKRTQVEVANLTKQKIVMLVLIAAIVTTAFYFILRALGNANLIVSTVSVTTSCVAASLTFLRSPLYGLAYAANDIVLIVLWILATIKDIAYLPMIICFSAFLILDFYGFINWTVMRKKQQADNAETQ
ncbi:MAG: nicotinamide mononucleotide transporter [Clostridiales bacterium]|nr:nicotinamide mononucleotide transporter [Clostridiales bacterium]